MNIGYVLFAEFHTRWRILKNSGGTYDKMQRLFAFLEILCFPLSMLTILSLIFQLILTLCGYGHLIPVFWAKYLSSILLAGAVGYLTNWLAIIMLFRPYDPIRWLFLWPQGMVPRNKPKVARAMGDQVGNKLLAPERLADEVSGRVIEYLSRPDVIATIKGHFQAFLHQHQETIITYLIPKVESALLEAIDKLVTPDNIRNFWVSELEPRLKNVETRSHIAEYIVKISQENTPVLVGNIQKKMRSHLQLKLVNFPFSEQIIDFVMEFFADSATMQNMIKNWLGEPNTLLMLQDKMKIVAGKLNEWINSAEAEDKINTFSADAKAKLKQFLSGYLHEALPRFAQSTLESEELWNWIETKMLPEARTKLVGFIQDNKQEIIDSLNLAKRIENAINEQDIRKFHEMINNIAAQHLGVIQVLGFVLGVIIGGIQLIQTLLFNV